MELGLLMYILETSVASRSSSNLWPIYRLIWNIYVNQMTNLTVLLLMTQLGLNL